ncbi:MAG TPA: formate--tetrahydrofolate ligase [Gaiellaceae bacterium]|nr:formate--tetrahydrofolate ligase [Gaiellaceae bacterium]
MGVATETAIRPIAAVAGDLGLDDEHVEPHGRYTAKINLAALGAAPRDGKLVCVTAVTPTKAGEGKTTTAISLADALGLGGDNPVLCLREPSLGPVFGLKGGGTGGGRAQVFPPELVNLHFTGDIHAIGAANNLLAALVEAHLLHGNELRIDPLSISWRRCLDMDDRALRRIVVGLGGRANGAPRETGFDITAASEVMAIVAVSQDYDDLRARLGAITVARDAAGERVTAEQLRAAGAMAALLVDALKPNLIQTLEGVPALVHCGPFANIAHGNNSIVADMLGLELGDYVVTESGFGAEMGFEKFVDIVCGLGDMRPAAVVVVATTQALEHHGADGANLEANLRIVREVGIEPVVAINRFPTDTRSKTNALRKVALELGAYAAEVNDGYEHGGAGAAALAEAVKAAAARPAEVRPLYAGGDPLRRKLEAVARKAYGAADVELAPAAVKQLRQLEADGLDHLPVCIAKTHLSLSHDPNALGAPRGFTLPVRELRPYTGAGWIVALCGDMQTMPGLPSKAAAFEIDVDGETIRGLR